MFSVSSHQAQPKLSRVIAISEGNLEKVVGMSSKAFPLYKKRVIPEFKSKKEDNQEMSL